MKIFQNPDSISPSTIVRALMASLGEGPMTLSEIAGRWGLGASDMSKILDVLVLNDWVRRISSGSSHSFEIAPHRVTVLGGDIGGTKVHLALADITGNILAEEIEPTDPRGGSHVVDQIGAIAERLNSRSGSAHTSLSGAVIGCAGVLDRQSGKVNISPNIPGLDTIDVLMELRSRLGCSVVLENDVNLAALGEQSHGGCAGTQNFVFVALGTGIGMGVVAGGQLIEGARGAAGEIAFLPVGDDPFNPANYPLGPLETAIGSAGIVRYYRSRGGRKADTVQGIFERLTIGDSEARETIDHTARVLLQALIAVHAILDPGAVVLGGSIGARVELVHRVRALMAQLNVDLPVQESSLGNRAVSVGAVSLAIAQACGNLITSAD